MSPRGMPLPSESFFASAETAMSAMDEAVSNPNSRYSQL